MTLIERVRFRLAMLKAASKAVLRDVHRGLTLMPIAGADGAEEVDGGKEGVDAEKGKEAEEAETGKDEEGESKKDEPFDEARAKEALSKKNREAQGLRTRLKDAEAKAKKYDELEDAKKSESEKLNEKAASAEQRATKAVQDAARLRVALKKGLTETQAKRLVGEDEEELEADADALLEDFSPKKDEEDEGKEKDDGGQESTSQRRPKERLRPGAAPNAETDKRGPKELAESVPRTW